jgi:hypothetical protein
VYLSGAQLQTAMAQRSEADALTSSSTLLFHAQAACIAPDTWIVRAGPWARKVINFMRVPDDADADGGRASKLVASGAEVDSFAVDGLCFERRAVKPCGQDTDAYACTRCGSQRRFDNYVYAENGELKRGRYPCVVCRRPTIHIKATEVSTTREAWSKSMAGSRRPQVPGLASFTAQ